MRQKFRETIESDKLIILPSAYDCISAKLIEKVGYDAVYVGSYTTAASMYGLPDANIIERKDMLDQCNRIFDSVNVPVIADGENGYGDVVQVIRTIELFEKAGIAGIHLEDHESGKHQEDAPQVILDTAAMVKKIEAAVDARSDKNFLVIGRTDILFSVNDFEKAIDRCIAYLEAGADLVFIAGFRPHHLPLLKGRLNNKLVVTCTSPDSVAMYAQYGIKLLIYYSLTLLSVYPALEKALTTLKETGSIAELSQTLGKQNDFENFIGFPQIRETYHKYST